MTAPLVGLNVLAEQLAALDLPGRRALLRSLVDAGLDHVHIGDHVSFRDGTGFDGNILAASLLALQDELPVYDGLYLLALRHPVLIARELSTLSELAPGRYVLGVGVGGDDRREVEHCGVDPRTRGRPMDEMLAIMRPLLAGEEVTYDGEFFQLEATRIKPPADPAVPFIIGGRSEAGIRRAGRLGDGWLGIWISASRFARSVEQVQSAADAAGRTGVDWRHGMVFWCGLDDAHPDAARPRMERDMEALYRVSAANFAPYCPAGRAEDVAEFIAPFVAAGAQDVSLVARGPDPETTVALAGEVARLLKAG